MNQFPVGSPESKAMELANKTVFAISHARLIGNPEEAGQLFDYYLTDARRAGVSLMTAWAILSSAGVAQFTSLLINLAAERGTTPDAELSRAALDHAREALT